MTTNWILIFLLIGLLLIGSWFVYKIFKNTKRKFSLNENGFTEHNSNEENNSLFI